MGVDGDGHLFYSTDSVRGNPVVVCTRLERCAAPSVCFELTTEFGICDAAQAVERTECTPPEQARLGMDECGCEGRGCGVGETCIAFEDTCSCAPAFHNICVPTACEAPSDCSDGSVCTPSGFILSPEERCSTPACAGDADCTADGQGRCALMLNVPLQGGELRLLGVECVYGGLPTDIGVCVDARSAYPDGHTCP